eukprot:Seg6987.1 transcript_id=Seg6987.1/GoldUCD/mRNA.D3Y31 product="D2 dopamine receptor A" protein_id=Seg6987.1/GoldUCD/D3Y31
MSKELADRCYAWPNSDVMPRIESLSIAILFGCFGAVSLTGNAIILLCIIKFKRLRSTSNLLIAHLSTADFIIGISCPLNVSVYALGSKLPCPVFYMTGFQTSFFCITSILLLVVISIDRYVHIVKFQMYVTHFTRKRVMIMAVCAWLLSGLLSTIYFTIVDFYFHIVLLTVTILSVSIIVVCYWKIFRKMRSSSKALSQHQNKITARKKFSIVERSVANCANDSQPPTKERQSSTIDVEIMESGDSAVEIQTDSKQSKATTSSLRKPQSKGSSGPKFLSPNKKSMTKDFDIAITMAIVIFAVSFCWTPFMVMSFIRSAHLYMTGDRDSYPSLYHWFLALGFGNSSINPLIYCWRNKAFRDAIKELFHTSEVSANIVAGVAGPNLTLEALESKQT